MFDIEIFRKILKRISVVKTTKKLKNTKKKIPKNLSHSSLFERMEEHFG